MASEGAMHPVSSYGRPHSDHCLLWWNADNIATHISFAFYSEYDSIRLLYLCSARRLCPVALASAFVSLNSAAKVPCVADRFNARFSGIQGEQDTTVDFLLLYLLRQKGLGMTVLFYSRTAQSHRIFLPWRGEKINFWLDISVRYQYNYWISYKGTDSIT